MDHQGNQFGQQPFGQQPFGQQGQAVAPYSMQQPNQFNMQAGLPPLSYPGLPGGVAPMPLAAGQQPMGSMGGGVPTVDDRTAAEQAANAFAPDDVDSATSVAQMKQSLRQFWAQQQDEMERLEVGSEQDFKNHNDLPLARIKRIMKSDEDVRMISAEAPVLFAKACEMFILELTLRSWFYSEKNKRRTLQKEDIQTAIRKTEIFDFLVDVIQ